MRLLEPVITLFVFMVLLIGTLLVFLIGIAALAKGLHQATPLPTSHPMQRVIGRVICHGRILQDPTWPGAQQARAGKHYIVWQCVDGNAYLEELDR